MLLSFTLQVELYILAELRRRIDSGLLRIFAWSAYQLADTVAIFVLGHLSVISRSPEHELMLLWAPFLLLHLGSQDNITAYAIEDNQLWLRHLQTFVSQVAAASYVLYESSILSNSRSLLRPVAILMFVVGVAKYGERVWALRCAGSTPSGNNYMYYERRSRFRRSTAEVWDCGHGIRTEKLLLTAHLMLDIPRDLFKGPLPRVRVQEDVALGGKNLFKVAEMQLSLMHDVFYTKAEVMCTWYGICIHIILMICTAVAFSSFNHYLDSKSGSSNVDASVTHVLFIGAVILQFLSVIRAMFSSWTLADMVKVCSNQRIVRGKATWESLTAFVMGIRLLSCAAQRRRRYWSGSMGQHNLFRLCAHRRTSRSSKIARWMGVEDPWNTLVYSGSIRVSASVKQLVVNRVHQWRRAAKMGKVSPQALGHMIGSWGLAALTDHGGLHESLSWAIDVPLEEGILIWHVATNIYLSWYRKQVMAAGNQTDEQLGTQAEELSNYMLFLLSARPYMLSPLASRKAYVEMCYGLTGLGCSSVEELATALQNYGDTLNRGSSIKFTYTTIDIAMDDPLRHDKTLERGIKLGAELIANPVENKLSLVSQVWVEMLCYAGYNCSTYSHAKQLSKGGEFISIAALLVKYIICDINLPIISDHDKW
ncbi:hypothetical protein HU200_051102 [Digitaria exilis]|uniref:DUF4220 domain-containing protein n=1 Tax=Digitaria exilis TaxID=1010633 RepID=A0A835AQS9_9POAL|nr:hypothetical protein HU200_051102 [Digitaria exilis]